MLSVMRQIGRRMELMNSPQQAHVSLPQLQVSSFDIEEVSGCVAPDIETFTCTVGKKPTAAASYLNDVSEVHELLEALNRISTRDHAFYSSVDLRSLTGVNESGMYDSMTLNSLKPEIRVGDNKQASVETITAGFTRSMSMGAMSSFSSKPANVSTSLTQFLGAIGDEEEEEEDAFFF